jgi:alpha-amylase/alpha-mannosidase (GH57 family)
MERYISIHGHFYQPPRENPWLEAIELQDSAYPYHDWNDRIAAECYAPNAASRILDSDGKIVQIVNNYSKISFDFGPTLLTWLESRSPKVYQAVLAADVESRLRFSGHGSAIAQAYNHMILPLANRRDKYTQVLWGIRDFEYRFGRQPEGMWLPETAVDLETLDLLTEFGIQFTILSPHQARRARRIGVREWSDVSGGLIDPTAAYQIELPSGRKISLFFYDGPVSRAVAFERLLVNGEDFANRLVGAFSAQREHSQLVHIATDGESYGHHTWLGDMGLAYALRLIESRQLARLTNYGEYLEKHPPQFEVEIFEDSSWSCPHGLERWRSDCGCGRDPSSGGNQAWRAPLRQALDWLRNTLAPPYEKAAGNYLRDPWAARNDYISVILDRSDASLRRFLGSHALAPLDESAETTVLKLLEMQRHAMLMYTSCGWFFVELSGIETVQVIQYASRALQLAEELLGRKREGQFLARLAKAKSNVPEHQDGSRIYEKCVRPARADLKKLAAHYGMSSLFEDYPERSSIFCYTVHRLDYQPFEIGRARLAAGRARFTSDVTREAAVLTFGVLLFGDYNLNAGVLDFHGEEAYRATVQELGNAFSMADFPQVVLLLDKHFGTSIYSIRSLFRDQQRRVLNTILASSLSEAEAHYREIYELRVPLMRFLTDLGIPLPRAFQAAAEFTINRDLRRIFEGEEFDAEPMRRLLNEASSVKVALDVTTLEYTLRKAIEKMMRQLDAAPDDGNLLHAIQRAVGLGASLPFEINLWTVQNIYYEMLQAKYPAFLAGAERGDGSARVWVDRFTALGAQLGIRISVQA